MSEYWKIKPHLSQFQSQTFKANSSQRGSLGHFPSLGLGKLSLQPWAFGAPVIGSRVHWNRGAVPYPSAVIRPYSATVKGGRLSSLGRVRTSWLYSSSLGLSECHRVPSVLVRVNLKVNGYAQIVIIPNVLTFKGVFPNESTALISALWSVRYCTTPRLPTVAATWSAVLPSEFGASTSTPSDTRRWSSSASFFT